ncbi:hypothetical protein JD844_031624 [Phrynosoma platyrhinos]|uniref:Neurexin/syndecan/glycophorin C domain-containing protein n=1 Tax=Phrynosoma platyrhinos TaxID=52577 RepID=A0ABQ7T271_PHRPL|nr:hypothetical protein JD844_031624 [Phrynosoma platyrhinos]
MQLTCICLFLLPCSSTPRPLYKMQTKSQDRGLIQECKAIIAVVGNTSCFLIVADSRAGEESAITAVDHAVIGGVVAVVVFAMLCLLIILGRYFARHKGTYFTHEAKGADDAADADTAIINAEGGQNNSEEKKEYFI